MACVGGCGVCDVCGCEWGGVVWPADLQSMPIDTKGYESLLNIKSNTEKDSFDLYYGLFLYNQNATDELQRLEAAFADVKKELFGRLHDLVREDLLGVREAPPPCTVHAPVKVYLRHRALHLA